MSLLGKGKLVLFSRGAREDPDSLIYSVLS